MKDRIRHDHIDARKAAVSEGNSHVDHQPVPVVLPAETIKVQIHSNFTRAAQRHEHDIHVVFSRHTLELCL